MKVIWIVLIAFTFAVLPQGNSLPSRNPTVANISPGFSSNSVKHRPHGTANDFTGTGSDANDIQHSNTPSWGAQKSNELLISRELNKLLKLKHINLGKHFSKKVAHLLKSRPGLLASFNKELKDASYLSPNVRDAQLPGLPKSIHETTMNLNEQGPEMDDRMINSSAELTNAGTVSLKPESDNPEAKLADEKHKRDHKGNPSAPEGLEPKSETDKVSGSDIDWDSGEQEEQDPESETDELSQSDTDWNSSDPEDIEPRSDTEETSESHTDWHSGEPEDEDPESEEDELSGSGTAWDSGDPEDEGPETEEDKLSESGTDLNSGIPEDEDPKSEIDETSGSDTDWDVSDPTTEKDKLSESGTDSNSGESEDDDPESEAPELLGSGTDLDSAQPEDMEPQLETDKLSSDTEWGTRKKNVDSKDLVISSELNKLLKLRHIKLEKHLSKKVARLLKSRPSLLASFHKELKDASQHSSKMRDAHLRQLPKSIQGTTVNANEQPTEIDDQVSNSAPQDMDLQSISEAENLPSDTAKWGSGVTEDAGEVPLSVTEWDAALPQTHEAELKHNVFLFSDDESDTGGAPGAAESKSVISRRSRSSSQDNPESVPSVEAPEQDTKLPIKLPNTVVMKKLPSTGNKFETKRAKDLPVKISKKETKMVASSGSRLSGISIPHEHNGKLNLNIKLESLGNQGVHSHNGKTEESGEAVVRVLTTLFTFGVVLVVVMMAACFSFAWPLRTYCQMLSLRVSGSDGDNLQSIGVDRNQPPAYQPQGQQEPTSAYSTIPKKKTKTKTKDEVISDDKKRDSRNVERRKIIKQQTSQRRASLADSIAIAKSVIDGHSKNEQFERKASERRRVIKQCTSAPGSSVWGRQRSMSFHQELQTGCSVILPGADHQKSVEKSKDSCRIIKDRSAGKERRSLAEEIGDAKKVIVDSERKY